MVTAMPWLCSDEKPQVMPTPVPIPEPTLTPDANSQAEVEKQEPEPTAEKSPLDTIETASQELSLIHI